MSYRCQKCNAHGEKPNRVVLETRVVEHQEMRLGEDKRYHLVCVGTGTQIVKEANLCDICKYSKDQSVTLQELLKLYPSGATVEVCIDLFNWNGSLQENIAALSKVLEIAKKYHVQTSISTNTNLLNPLCVCLDNYVLTHNLKNISHHNWGYQYSFFAALAKQFPGKVYIYSPKDENEVYVIDEYGKPCAAIKTNEATLYLKD